jgi:hypothetical protein
MIHEIYPLGPLCRASSVPYPVLVNMVLQVGQHGQKVRFAINNGPLKVMWSARLGRMTSNGTPRTQHPNLLGIRDQRKSAK